MSEKKIKLYWCNVCGEQFFVEKRSGFWPNVVGFLFLIVSGFGAFVTSKVICPHCGGYDVRKKPLKMRPKDIERRKANRKRKEEEAKEEYINQVKWAGGI